MGAAQPIYASAASRRPMARAVSVGMLPDGTLEATPRSRPARFLRARYAGIRAGEHELPFTAMKSFRQVGLGQIPRASRRLTLKIRHAVPKEKFEGDIADFPGGVGMRKAINRRALERIARVCARRIRAPPAGLARVLAEPGARYTHVVASPNAYTACMGGMGWDIYPTFLDPMENSRLRISGKGLSHSLASLKLLVAIDYTVPDGSVYCFDARNMLLAMGAGTVAYDYAEERLSIAQTYALDVSRAGGGVELVVPVGGRAPRA